MEKPTLFLLLLLLCRPDVGLSYNSPGCDQGRTVIVHLFSWNWDDIAAECERFLGPSGFCGVQVSPPNEHRIVDHPNNPRPWWERYQPVSYRLVSRNGNEHQFTRMVQRCAAVHVKVYVDMVVNHMTGSDAGRSTGSGGSSFDAQALRYDGVPFGPTDFNCCNCEMCGTSDCGIQSYSDARQVRNCRLVGLVDLALSKEYVRDKVAGYFNHLMDIGVAGFRVDACKHMWPGDLEAIYSRLSKKPFIFNEVIDLGGEAIGADQYTHLGRITEFKFSSQIGSVFRRQNQLKNLKNFGEGWGMLPSDKAVVFVDNHDNQRGHGAGGSSVLTFWEPRMYKMATAFKLAWPYGFVRIMSSYSWPGGRFQNDWWGPPANADWSIKRVPIKEDGTCGDDWVCEHRWRQITNMVGFRNVADGQAVNNWWDNGNNQIAFSRGNKAFIAFNNEEWGTMNLEVQTGMPEGQYCDIISGSPTGSGCSGKMVAVDGQGMAHVNIDSQDKDPMVAIHAGSKVGSGPPATSPPATGGPPTPGPTPAPTAPPAGTARTVVMLRLQTLVGQDVFVRGGISHDQRPGCSSSAETSPCALSISHNSLGESRHYAGYHAWSVGDTRLDWYGAQVGQGTFNGQGALGSPSAWTSSSRASPGYQPVNKFGDHYWMMDVNMDCSQTESGWFELKGVATNYRANNGWESDVRQGACAGTAGGTAPYASNNHMARCGYVNVFEWNNSGCRIENL